jgi:hypothetical protein
LLRIWGVFRLGSGSGVALRRRQKVPGTFPRHSELHSSLSTSGIVSEPFCLFLNRVSCLPATNLDRKQFEPALVSWLRLDLYCYLLRFRCSVLPSSTGLCWGLELEELAIESSTYRHSS